MESKVLTTTWISEDIFVPYITHIFNDETEKRINSVKLHKKYQEIYHRNDRPAKVI